MAFYIQDPTYSKSSYLHESLISSCVGSTAGGGAYAFASKDGIELLIEDDNFKQFLKTGQFTLIVGMDDITNIYSIETLKRMREKYYGHLTIKAYIHNSKGSTFHPKYSWFAQPDGGILVIGSGNLTQKGLRQNREAYVIEKLIPEEMRNVVHEWDKWLEHSKLFLFDLDEDIVNAYAERNTERMRTIISIQKQEGRKVDVDQLLKYIELLDGQPDSKRYAASKKAAGTKKSEADEASVIYGEDLDIDLPYWTAFLNSEVLISEIPKSGSRWQQVNFDKNSFENFFGATCGENGVYRILFRNMGHDGILHNVEVRPGVSVSSQNYRFELDAAKGLDYPSGKERPIGVFVKVSSRDFMYELLMPGDEAYNACIEVLDNKEPYSTRMRRIRYRCQEIYQKTSSLALWKRLDAEEDE